MGAPKVIVVGGGVAGLATARALALRGAAVTLLEREPLFGSHASGRNAGIFRQLEHDLPGARLALRSDELLPGLPAEAPLLDRRGALYVGTAAQLDPLQALGVAAGVVTERLGAAELRTRVPALQGGDAEEGLFVPRDGVLDVHELVQALARSARAAGAELRMANEVTALAREGRAIVGVEVRHAGRLEAEVVVLAVGAWSRGLGAAAGLPMPIMPRRRHLVVLGPHATVRELGPVVWRLDEGVYVRRDPDGVLASPCDELEWEPTFHQVTPTSPEALEQLSARLARLSPTLAERELRRHWACLRSFAADGGLVVGRDPRVDGLVWVAGLGGRGMSVGVGLGEVAAAVACGEEPGFGEVGRLFPR